MALHHLTAGLRGRRGDTEGSHGSSIGCNKTIRTFVTGSEPNDKGSSINGSKKIRTFVMRFEPNIKGLGMTRKLDQLRQEN